MRTSLRVTRNVLPAAAASSPAAPSPAAAAVASRLMYSKLAASALYYRSSSNSSSSHSSSNSSSNRRSSNSSSNRSSSSHNSSSNRSSSSHNSSSSSQCLSLFSSEPLVAATRAATHAFTLGERKTAAALRGINRDTCSSCLYSHRRLTTTTTTTSSSSSTDNSSSSTAKSSSSTDNNSSSDNSSSRGSSSKICRGNQISSSSGDSSRSSSDTSSRSSNTDRGSSDSSSCDNSRQSSNRYSGSTDNSRSVVSRFSPMNRSSTRLTYMERSSSSVLYARCISSSTPALCRFAFSSGTAALTSCCCSSSSKRRVVSFFDDKCSRKLSFFFRTPQAAAAGGAKLSAAVSSQGLPAARAVPQQLLQQAQQEVRAAGSIQEALNERMIEVYTGETAQQLRKAAKKFHPFFRPVEGVERLLFAAEARVLLADPLLTLMSPSRSAKFCVSLPNESLPPLQRLLFKHFTRHRQHSNVAWRFLHLILERTEAEDLHEAFAVPLGFNGRFYFFLLHLWLLHKRLCYGVNRNREVEKQRQQLLQRTRAALLTHHRAAAAPAAAVAATSSNERGNRSLAFSSAADPTPAAAAPTTAAATAPTPAAAAGGTTAAAAGGTTAGAAAGCTTAAAAALTTAAAEALTAAGAGAFTAAADVRQTEAAGVELKLLRKLQALEEGDPFLVDKEHAVEGEMLDDILFKMLWDVIKDWLKQKKVQEARFEVELRNCQEHAFGFFAALDEALADEEIYPSRLKEALWANFYGGRINYGDVHLQLLSKYTLRQLTHLMFLPKEYFYKGYFTWADFCCSSGVCTPRVVPPLAQRVQYGGYTPEIAGLPSPLLSIGGRRLPQQLSSRAAAAAGTQRLEQLLTYLQSFFSFLRKPEKSTL